LYKKINKLGEPKHYLGDTHQRFYPHYKLLEIERPTLGNFRKVYNN